MHKYLVRVLSAQPEKYTFGLKDGVKKKFLDNEHVEIITLEDMVDEPKIRNGQLDEPVCNYKRMQKIKKQILTNKLEITQIIKNIFVTS
jgi:hypothetical protein